jgi:hypothetical protein
MTLIAKTRALLGTVGFILLGALCVLFRTKSFKEVWCGCFHENRWEFSASEGWCSCGFRWERPLR